MRLLSVDWPMIGWNDATAVAKDAVISSGVIVNGVMKSRRYEEEHKW